MADEKVFEAYIECQSCNGTGLYVGMAERDGSAVVCSQCDGTGKQHYKFTYRPFVSRVDRKDVRRVYKTAGTYTIYPDDVTTEADGLIQFSKGGASYEDWRRGVEPLPLKDIHCPLQHTGQTWSAPYCKENYIGTISLCKNRCNKAECWDIYEKYLSETKNQKLKTKD
jgi:hypothetical protein